MATLSQTATATLPAQLVTEMHPVFQETATSLAECGSQALEAHRATQMQCQ